MGDNFNNTNCGLLSGPLSRPEQGLITHGLSTRPSLVSINEVLRNHGSTPSVSYCPQLFYWTAAGLNLATGTLWPSVCKVLPSYLVLYGKSLPTPGLEQMPLGGQQGGIRSG